MSSRYFDTVDDVIKFLSGLQEGEVRLARSISFEIEEEASIADVMEEGLHVMSEQEGSEEAQTTGVEPGRYEMHAVIKLVRVGERSETIDVPDGYKN